MTAKAALKLSSGIWMMATDSRRQSAIKTKLAKGVKVIFIYITDKKTVGRERVFIWIQDLLDYWLVHDGGLQ